MSTPAGRARIMRAVLVALFSVLLTAMAHTAAGGPVPNGGSVPLLVAVSSAVGAIVGAMSPDPRLGSAAVLTAALGVGQLLGHLTLSVSSHHHGYEALLTTPMLAMHVVAAVVLALLISLVEYLYRVCASVLCWLRLFLVHSGPPSCRPLRNATADVAVQAILLRTGLGMRAPPREMLASG
jgi:hypothetical protein